MSPFPDRHGLQPERTALAWQRTALAATVVAVPMVLVNLRLHQWGLSVLGSAVAIGCAASLVGLRQRWPQLADDDRGYSPFPPMLRVAVVTVASGLVAVATATAVVLR